MPRDVVTIRNLSKAHGSQVLFDQAEAVLRDDQRIAIVGRNGTGKSTLCRMILGQEKADGGIIAVADGIRIGYLEQSDPFRDDETLHQALVRLSGQPEWRCAEVAARFRIDGDRLALRARDCSGGWQTRARLCALLLGDPDFLILDEPTNYLDLRTQLLLEDFLASYKGGYLIVSHDRSFLGRTCTTVLEVSQGKIRLSPGTIEDWLTQRAERREMIRRRNANLATKAKQLEDFVARNKARASTATQAASKAKQLERISADFLDEERDDAEAVIRLPRLGERRPGAALRCSHLAIGYGSNRVADGIDLEVERGSRVAILGDNGQGKSTLLKTLAEVQPALGGQARWGYAVRVGFYHQHVYEAIPAGDTVRTYLERCASSAPGYVTSQQVQDLAGAFLFRGAAIDKGVGVLSGGERARLCLAGLLVARFDVLLLDEPTNHLDVETAEALASALADHDGTLLVVCHDRSFVSRIATHVVELRDAKAWTYSDGYEAYLWRVERELRAEAAATEPPASGPKGGGDRKEQRRLAAEARNRLREAQNAVKRLDRERDQLTRTVTAEPGSPAGIAAAKRLADLQGEIDAAEEAWLAAAGDLEQLGVEV